MITAPTCCPLLMSTRRLNTLHTFKGCRLITWASVGSRVRFGGVAGTRLVELLLQHSIKPSSLYLSKLNGLTVLCLLNGNQARKREAEPERERVRVVGVSSQLNKLQQHCCQESGQNQTRTNALPSTQQTQREAEKEREREREYVLALHKLYGKVVLHPV